jgi:2-(1,2-epoxy-1,2-dihydrophenyl)acetyl-CoA isomerase
MYANIQLDRSDGIATLTLNRPEKLNAYTQEMGEEITHAFRALRDDADVRVVILTGAGRGFCAGVDLDHLKAHQAVGGEAKGPKLGEEDFIRELPLELIAYPKPVIAAINGAAIGVGITMALPCDIRIAAAGVKLGFTFAALGILPGLGSTHLLPRLVGPAAAKELVFSARVFLAEEAAAIGLVNKVVPGDALMNEARAMASAMAAHDPAVLAAAKQVLDFGAAHDMSEAMRNEQEQSAALRDLRIKKRDSL